MGTAHAGRDRARSGDQSARCVRLSHPVASSTRHPRTTAQLPHECARPSEAPPPSDIASKRRKIGSSLTAVEMRGLTKVQLGSAHILAATATATATATGLVLWLGITERRRTLAIATAPGRDPAPSGQLHLVGAAFVTFSGLLLGAPRGEMRWTATRFALGAFDRRERATHATVRNSRANFADDQEAKLRLRLLAPTGCSMGFNRRVRVRSDCEVLPLPRRFGGRLRQCTSSGALYGLRAGR